MCSITNKIYVDGISKNTTKMKLRLYFRGFGLVKQVTILRDTNEASGYGFVEFKIPKSVDLVLGI
jgi:RNA recognition motif-containing protein